MLADSDDVGFLLDSIGADGPGYVNISLDLDYDLFNLFLRSHGISDTILFSSVFAYTLSRFVGGEKVLFNIIDNGRDRFKNYDSIGMFVNTLPLLVDCTSQNVDSFLDYMSDNMILIQILFSSLFLNGLGIVVSLRKEQLLMMI